MLARSPLARPAIFSATVASLALLAGLASAADLPTGGQVVAGSGSINQNGTTLTVTQGSNRLVTDWQSFSIGQGHTVTFQQPSADAVALNRVLGSDVSVIQGALNANGKVFLVNPNGVTFTPSAQVNTGGLVAATLNLKTDDFMAGHYSFAGTSSNAILNQGNIQAAAGGTVALIAAHIVNTGTLAAPGGNVLLGAGSAVTLDLGGPVKIQVTQGALNTLIDQGGAVRAEGGLIYLTAKAAGSLATSVINNTGLLEAQTLATGAAGQIILKGDMATGSVNVAGKLDASAPTGGNGGFVETSAAHVNTADTAQVTTQAVDGVNGLWLIDPNNYTIAASGGNITGAALASNLASGNVQVMTSGAGGNLSVNAPIAWSQNKLTLQANNNILVNQNLVATGTGSLAFAYGQDTANGAGSAYTIANGVQVLIPAASNFTWQKGSAGVVNNLWFGNDALKISPNQAAALNGNGALLQPFYYDDGTQSRSAGWYKLTFSNYPLDFALGTGGTGTDNWNNTGQILSTSYGSNLTNIASAINNLSIDIAGYHEGLGTLKSTLNVNVAQTGGTADITNAYTLAANTNFIRTESTVKNRSNSSALSNVRLWVGTRDDYVGTSDSNYKTKGNLDANGFDPITAQTDEAKALKITEQLDGTGAAILFYSTSEGADTVTDYCCNFRYVVNKDPHASSIVTPREDGSYALYLRMHDLAAGQQDSLIWYYGAGQANHIDSIISQVGQASGAIVRPVTTNVRQHNAVAVAQATAMAPASQAPAPTAHAAPAMVLATPAATHTAGGPVTIGSLDVVQLSAAEMTRVQAHGSSSAGSQAGITGPSQVFVVDGGVHLPAAARPATSKEQN